MALWITLTLAAILVFTEPSRSETDMTVEYYASVSFTCDSLALNVSDNMGDVDHLYWILTDGTLVDSSSVLPKNMELSSNGYRLNITEVRDETFGYYHCIVMYNDKSLKTVRKGLNVNGPDYSKLYEQYRHSAMIGGIAAAVMLVVIATGCLVWNYRFKQDQEDRDDLYKVREDNSHTPTATYENTTFEMEDKIVPNEDKVNGTIDEKM